jgi:hypothetical protein
MKEAKLKARSEASRQNICNFDFCPFLTKLKRTTFWSLFPQGLSY